ncbi:MAG: YtxH domain-containing protein [Bacteroidota bacterium]
MANHESDYSKGFIIGALIGGMAGAVTALLLAPKSGEELRKDLSQQSTDFYGKASDYLKGVEKHVSENVMTSVNDGRVRAQHIIDSARHQAESLLENAERVLQEAKFKASSTKTQVQDKIDQVRGAAKASADAFRSEIKSSEDIEIEET